MTPMTPHEILSVLREVATITCPTFELDPLAPPTWEKGPFDSFTLTVCGIEDEYSEVVFGELGDPAVEIPVHGISGMGDLTALLAGHAVVTMEVPDDSY